MLTSQDLKMATYLVSRLSEVSFNLEKHPELFIFYALKHLGHLFRMKEDSFQRDY